MRMLKTALLFNLALTGCFNLIQSQSTGSPSPSPSPSSSSSSSPELTVCNGAAAEFCPTYPSFTKLPRDLLTCLAPHVPSSAPSSTTIAPSSLAPPFCAAMMAAHPEVGCASDISVFCSASDRTHSNNWMVTHCLFPNFQQLTWTCRFAIAHCCTDPGATTPPPIPTTAATDPTYISPSFSSRQAKHQSRFLAHECANDFSTAACTFTASPSSFSIHLFEQTQCIRSNLNSFSRRCIRAVEHVGNQPIDNGDDNDDDSDGN